MDKDPTTAEAADHDGGLPERLISLRRKLHQKAKQQPHFRFWSLYGQISRMDVLQAAWERVRANKGGPGIDGTTLEEIESEGAGVFLQELQTALKSKNYQAGPVRRVHIPMANGGQRPLGIPTVRDRVVQMATLLVLEPIFEADFLDCSYGFRPERSAHQALEQIRTHLKSGYRAVYDAEGLLRHDPTREADGLPQTAHQRWNGAPADSDVAGSARGGARAGRSQPATRAGPTTGRDNLHAVGERLSPLVRQDFPPQGWPRPMGQRQAGPVRR